MDKERANVAQCLAEIKEDLEITPVPLQIPMGSADTFKGVISLLKEKAYIYDGSTGKYKETDIPAEYADDVASAWEALTEAIAETDDALMEKYLETLELSKEECLSALPAALESAKIVPVVYTSATNLMGIELVLDLIAKCAPNPHQRSAVAIKRGDADEMLKGSANASFSAVVIRSFIDDFSGKQTIIRILNGKTPADGSVVNVRTGDPERLGSLYTLHNNNHKTLNQNIFNNIIINIAYNIKYCVCNVVSASVNHTINIYAILRNLI